MKINHSDIIDYIEAVYLDDCKSMIITISHADLIAYIQSASLDQCKAIVDALVDRVSDLVGCATELEDAACMIQKELDADTERENA